MTKEQVLGIIRHTLTFVGGILIMKGIATEAVTQEAIGAIVAAVGAVWSVIKNKPTTTA
jgi:hypothetical protein